MWYTGTAAMENEDRSHSWDVGELKMIRFGNQLIIQSNKGKCAGQMLMLQG